MGAQQAGVALDHVHLLPLQQALNALGEPLHHLAAAVHGVRVVGSQAIHLDAEFLGAMKEGKDLGVPEQRLARNASPVEADTSQLFPLDNRDSEPELTGPNGGHVAACSRADHHQVVVSHRQNLSETTHRHGLGSTCRFARFSATVPTVYRKDATCETQSPPISGPFSFRRGAVISSRDFIEKIYDSACGRLFEREDGKTAGPWRRRRRYAHAGAYSHARLRRLNAPHHPGAFVELDHDDDWASHRPSQYGTPLHEAMYVAAA